MLPAETTVALIGTEPRLVSIAVHLHDAGYGLVVTDNGQGLFDDIIGDGVKRARTVTAACANAQVIITMLPYPEDVEDVYLGTDGIMDSSEPGSYLIDLSTSVPQLARELFTIGAINELHVLDCPLAGGEVAARDAGLTMFVGGERDDMVACESLLSSFTSRISYQGIAGSGQVAKLANQIALASSLLGAVEALVFAQLNNLDRQNLASALSDTSGGGWVMDNLMPLVIDEEFISGYSVELFCKDLSIALEIADDMSLTMPGTETAYQLLDLLTMVSDRDMSIQALALVYEDEEHCMKHGIDWSRVEGDIPFGYGDDDDDDTLGIARHHHHHHPDSPLQSGPGGTTLGMSAFFSEN